MVEPLRHRQTKEAATDMFSLQPPRHIPTLPIPSVRMRRRYVRMTPDRVGLAAAPHQIRTRFSGARKSLSLGLTLKALYQASMLRTTPSTRYFTGAWGFETI